MAGQFTRRDLLSTTLGAGVALSAGCAVGSRADAADRLGKPGSFTYCLNTSTIRGQKVGIVKEIEIAAKAGFQGIEPWIGGISKFQQDGGALKDLGKRIADLGLTVESAIGFANWIVDDDAKRAAGLEQAKRDMHLLKQIGGKRIAAPPVGAHRGGPKLDLFKAAERYRDLLKVGDQAGVVPQVEVWGFASNLSRLGESMFVVLEAGHRDACLLPDVYHIYKGGSDFAGLNCLSGRCIQVFHMNDYPADPPRDKIGDADRVYPGDGVAPLTPILRDVAAGGGVTSLSLELFNRDYWKQDPLEVAKTGLAKMKAAVAKAGLA